VKSPSLSGSAATDVGAESDAAPASRTAGDGEESRVGRGVAPDQRLFRAAVALSLLPLAVSAVALVVGTGGDYLPTTDHALTEMQVRDVGRHPVLVGLYSRADWSHPGPLQFYALAPFYWLTGGASIGLSLGALAINGGSIAGMAAMARRRGGTPLALCVLLGCALLVRTLGAGFVQDPWNCYVTTLPFGVMILLAWSMAAGETWALPVGAVVASFLAQTHVGFLALALPLLAWGAGWLVVTAWRQGNTRSVRRAAGLTAGLLAVLWLPAVLDLVVNSPSNAGNIVRWFTSGDEPSHTLAEGWRVMTAQLALWPEWLAGKRTFAFGTGESRYLGSAPLPVLLVPAAAAAVALWRRARDDGRTLVLTLALTLVLGVVAVARTVGPAFDYRLRWTWVPAMLVLAATAWAAWLALARRGAPPKVVTIVTVVPLAALAVLGAVNTSAAATGEVPLEGDSEVMARLMPQILDALPEGDGDVVVSDVYANGAWYARGIVLALERRGIDARVPPDLGLLFGDHRVHRDGPVRAHLVVFQDEGVGNVGTAPGLRLVARWAAAGWQRAGEIDAAMRDLEADEAAGRIGRADFQRRLSELADERDGDSGATAYAVGVFVDERDEDDS
jgi:hypothetical protein